jgi:N-acyl-D-amino-acid deacylase
MSVRGGPERVQVAGVASAKNAKVASGKTIAQLAELWSMSPVDTVIRLILEEDGAVGAVYFSMSEEDMKAILADSHVAVGSDGRGMKAETDSGKATHPRSYGTFPRVIGRFVREGVLPLERAVYKMTGLPAERLRLSNRGFIRPGYAADVTVFDPVTVADQADFANPHQYPVGIEYVLVNGQLAAKDGRLTGQAAGRVLRKRL